MSDRDPVQTHGVPFREAARFWVKLGFINFGGPTGQIAVMHDEIVERRKWISNGRFLHALNYCILLPGPEAQQLAIYIGWLLHKVRGGMVAGIMFVLPSFFVMLALSWLYAVHGDVTWVSAIFESLAAAVVGIVGSATIRIGKKALANGLMLGVAVAAFVSIFLLQVVVTWATFAPCFLWIFLGAPYIERLRGNVRLGAALQTITAAVVGVIANLAVTFAVHTLFEQVRGVDVVGGTIPVPVWSSVDVFAVVVASVSFVGLWRLKWKIIPVVAASAVAGLVVKGVFGV